MNTLEEDILLKYLVNLPFVYRDKLSVPEDSKFGVEIEFMTNKKNEVDKIAKKIVYTPTSNKKYYRVVNSHNFYAGMGDKSICEVKSPILSNNETDFSSLKKACDELSKFNVLPSNQKGVHIHADLSLLEENERFLTTFLKIFCIYEHIIFRFSYGEEDQSNINISSYSREISNRIYRYLLNHDINTEFNTMLSEIRELLKCKSYALNFHKKDFNCKNETIEFRTFNSTYNPVIIQNDVNFVLNLINQIINSEIDLDLLDYRFNDYNPGFYVKDSYSELNLSDAVELSELVFNSTIDRDYFLRQYAVKSKPKTKKLVI